jgi:hypothetical protein
MSNCPSCGAEVSPRAKFCSECGARLATLDSTISYSPIFEEEDEGEAFAGGGGPPGSAALIELDQVEGTAGRRMHDIMGGGVTVGRSPDRDIFIDDVTVSREHAEILRNEKGYRIKDSGSLNGTYVNRVRVDSVDLRNGDEIQIGKFRFKFVVT